ncbi:MAG: VWA domain-containing protein [Beijerinckiaceae bacterium]|nr:VWA domain-containing protein [Beijerinckiaceae bacterium]
MFTRLSRDESGSIAVVFGIALFTLTCAVGAGLDYTRMVSTRTALSMAADAAAIAAGQAPPGEAVALAREVFNANFREQNLVASFSAAPFLNGADDAFRVEVTANVPMTLSKVMGVDERPVRIVSEALLGGGEDIQIGLVLDVTGSMAGAKLDSLKTASSAMVNALYDKLKKANQVKIAVVPFAEYVNVGMQHRNQPWLAVPPDTSTTQQVCRQTRDVTRTYNCRMQVNAWQECNDGVCVSKSGAWEVCDYDYGPEYQTCGMQTTNVTWSGCVGSRFYPLNVRDQDYTLNPVPGVMNVSCPPPLTPLSSSRPSVLKSIDELSPSGETYIPAGLMWGWAALSPLAPYSEPTNPTAKTKQYIVLMTDGENTRSPNYPYHQDAGSATSDTLTSELCANIKAAGLGIFTIAFDVNAITTKNLLRACASSPDNYFDATSTAQLAAAFDSIAKQMTVLRLTR